MTTRQIPAHVDRRFLSDLKATAAANGKTPEEVYFLWHKYSEDCRAFDQSAIWSEFLNWYRAELPRLAAGMYRLGDLRTFQESECSGAFDGFSVISDADPGL